jgi:hypothetical protein
MSDHYILDNHKAVKCDLMTWARWFEEGCDNRRVAQDQIGDVKISTVFLGINHQWGEGPPLLFETMIFGGEHDEFQERCTTWEQAEEMHARALRMVAAIGATP